MRGAHGLARVMKTYRHLKAGKYTFRVRGHNSAGTNGPTASKSFKIH
jgi:predicted phage tail protein